jgi:hypothetical protein
VYQDLDSPVLVHEPNVVIPFAGMGIEFDSDETRPGVAKQ